LHSLYCPIGAKGGIYSNWWEKTVAARLAFERLDRVIAVTENVRDSLLNAGVQPEKIELVPMSVDTERFCPRVPRESPKYFPDADMGTRLLFVGNASKEKGLKELLQAVNLLNDKGLRVLLVAAVENQCGIKEYAAEYEIARSFVHRAGMEANVRFVGLVDSIEDLYAESDLVLIPWSTSRGPSDYPMVALEAMAMGKCIVSTPVGGCPDLLQRGRAGVLTQGFSPEDIAAAIELAIKNPAHRETIEEYALARVRDFSLANSADQLLALYEHLLRSKGHRHAKCAV
jgi:glycosyltransferase involved in cell wall biosynthesis